MKQKLYILLDIIIGGPFLLLTFAFVIIFSLFGWDGEKKKRSEDD